MQYYIHAYIVYMIPVYRQTHCKKGRERDGKNKREREREREFYADINAHMYRDDIHMREKQGHYISIRHRREEKKNTSAYVSK